MCYCSSALVQACNFNVPPHCKSLNANPRLCPEFPMHPVPVAASAGIISAVPFWLFKKGRMRAGRWTLPWRYLESEA